jgi:hypothetical protein
MPHKTDNPMKALKATIAWFCLIRRFFLRRWLNWKYRKQDPDVCCCGCMLGHGGSICHHGGCRSMKEYVITTEMGEDRSNPLT